MGVEETRSKTVCMNTRRTFVAGFLGFLGAMALPCAGAVREPRTWNAIDIQTIALGAEWFGATSDVGEVILVATGRRNDGAHFFSALRCTTKEGARDARPILMRRMNSFLESDCTCGPGGNCEKHVSGQLFLRHSALPGTDGVCVICAPSWIRISEMKIMPTHS